MKIFKWPLGILGILLISGALYVYIKANSIAESYIKRSIPKNTELKFSNLSVNVFNSQLSIFDVDLSLFNESNGVCYATIQSKSLKLDGFSYWQYFYNDLIQIQRIHIQEPITSLYPLKRQNSKDSLKQPAIPIKQKVLIKYFEISNGKLYVMKDGEDSIQLSAKKIHLNLSDIIPEDSILSGEIPIKYRDINFEMSELYVNMGNYEEVFVEHSAIDNHRIELSELSVKSKYSKSQMLSIMPEEREHFDIKIPVIILDSIELVLQQNTFNLYAPFMRIPDAKLNFYLDKRLKDRNRIRPMYSKMIRNLPFKLDIDSTHLENWLVVYDEKHEANIKSGRVSFENLNADILNLTNVSGSENSTRIKAHFQVMGQGTASIDWKFDVLNTKDEFTLKGKVSDFKAGATNQFLNSFVKTRLSGEVEQIYFNIAGDDVYSSGDFKMKYKDLNIEILKDDRSKKHKLKSLIGNLILDDGKNADDDGYRHGQISVTRNQKKPFFNYLWLNVKDGIENTVRVKIRKQKPR